MEVKFSKHALDQLKVRSRITKDMVIDVIKQPDNSTSSFRGRKIYRKKFGNEYLEVVAVIEDNKLIVITQYIVKD